MNLKVALIRRFPASNNRRRAKAPSSIPNRNPASGPLRRDLLLDPKMLFDRSDPLKRMINLFAVSCRIVSPRLQSLDIASNICEFCVDFSEILSRLIPKLIKLLAKRF